VIHTYSIIKSDDFIPDI